jgi:glycosyltransferase involved in cell wall biosynthesis
MQDSILMLMSKYHKFSGHVRVVENLSIGLDKLGFDITIASPMWEKDPPECIKKISLNRFKTVDSQIPHKINLIHNHQTLMNYYSLFTKRPFIFHYHGASTLLQRINLKISMNICKNHLTKIISVSYSAENQINNLIKNTPSQIIYNGVDNRLYQNIKKIESNGDPQLLFVGNLFEYKKVQIIILAMKKILIDFPNAYFQIIGQGEFSEKLKKLIEINNLQKNVKIIGKVDDHELRQRYASCDIYISASSFETFGLPLLEAMASGKPVLGSNIPAHKELIEASKAGLIFEYDVDEIAEKVKDVYENRAELGKLGKKFAEKHDWEQVCKQVADVYKNLI